MSVSPTDPGEVHRVIKSSKNTRQAGWDGVPSSVTKAAAHKACKLLSCLINYTFETDTFDGFPDKLNFSDIKHLHKNYPKS